MGGAGGGIWPANPLIIRQPTLPLEQQSLKETFNNVYRHYIFPS